MMVVNLTVLFSNSYDKYRNNKRLMKRRQHWRSFTPEEKQHIMFSEKIISMKKHYDEIDAQNKKEKEL